MYTGMESAHAGIYALIRFFAHTTNFNYLCRKQNQYSP